MKGDTIMYREEGFEKALLRTFLGIMLIFVGFVVLSMGLLIYYTSTSSSTQQANWTGTVIVFPFMIIHTDNPWLLILVLLLVFVLFFALILLFFKSVSRGTSTRYYP